MAAVSTHGLTLKATSSVMISMSRSEQSELRVGSDLDCRQTNRRLRLVTRPTLQCLKGQSGFVQQNHQSYNEGSFCIFSTTVVPNITILA